MHTKIASENGAQILFIDGRLDHAATTELEKAAAAHAPDGSGDLHIDLSGVDYLSSAALKVFEELADRLSRNGGRLRLRAPSVAARLSLEFSGLERLVD